MTFSSIKDVDLIILSYLDDRTLLVVRSLNKYLNAITQDDTFWLKRSSRRFALHLDTRKADESWQQFYLWHLQSEMRFIGNLVRSNWNQSPFFPYNQLPEGSDYIYFHDQFDNWVVYSHDWWRVTYTYISNVQKDTDERIIILYKHDFSHENDKACINVYDLQLLYYMDIPDIYTRRFLSLDSAKYADDTLRLFFEKKEKQHWLFPPNENARQTVLSEFKQSILNKIEPFQDELEREINEQTDAKYDAIKKQERKLNKKIKQLKQKRKELKKKMESLQMESLQHLYLARRRHFI